MDKRRRITKVDQIKYITIGQMLLCIYSDVKAQIQ